MIPLQAAVDLVLGCCSPLQPTSSAIGDALGCVAATQVRAGAAVPAFANSAMDGYAVRSSDVALAPATLSVTGTATAGTGGPAVGPGEAVRIMTGAPVPAGADAVCMVERTRPGEAATVVVEEAVGRGENIRLPGEDVRAGQVVVEAGTVLQPAHIGVLAAVGSPRVDVYPRPVVGVMSTGDELADDGAALRPGMIHDANRHALLAAVRANGAAACDLGIIPDDLVQLEAALRSAGEQCDLVLTSGGVSVGDLDVVRLVLDRVATGGVHRLQVAIRPAKPLALATLAGSGTPLIGLPGNPVSALVAFAMFAVPAIRALGGHAPPEIPRLVATTTHDLLRGADGKVHLLRSRLVVSATGSLVVTAVAGQASHHLHAMAGANALIVLPDGSGAVAGDQVDVVVLDPASAFLPAGADVREPTIR